DPPSLHDALPISSCNPRRTNSQMSGSSSTVSMRLVSGKAAPTVRPGQGSALAAEGRASPIRLVHITDPALHRPLRHVPPSDRHSDLSTLLPGVWPHPPCRPGRGAACTDRTARLRELP